MLSVVLWCVLNFCRVKWEENSQGKCFAGSFIRLIKGSEKFEVVLLRRSL